MEIKNKPDEEEVIETDEEKKLREAESRKAGKNGKHSAPPPKSVTCPKCVTEFDGSTGDILKTVDDEPEPPPDDTPDGGLDKDTDYITPPLMDNRE